MTRDARAARVRSASWVIALAAILVASWAWAFASPVGASPDEDFHLASIWCAPNAHSDLCTPTGNPATRNLSQALTNVTCFAADNSITAGCQYTNINPDRFSVSDRGNFKSNYPPVFYWVMSVFASNDVPLSVLIMRLVNATLLIALLGVTLWLSDRRLRIPVLIAFTVTILPLGIFLIGSINPSSWAIVLVPTSWLALYGSLTSTERRRKIALGGLYLLTAALAAGARGDAAVFAGIGTVLAVLLAWTGRGFVRKNGIILSIIGAGLFAVAVFFFSSAQANVVQHGLPGVTGATAEAARSSTSGAATLLFFNLAHLPSLWLGSFGTWGLGWIDTPMAEVVPFATVFATAALIIVSIGAASRRLLGAGLLVLAALVVIPIAILQVSAASVGQQVQPRYLLPVIVLGAFVLATAPVTWDRRALRPVSIGLMLLIPANALAVFTNVLRYTNGLQSGIDLGHPDWWWGAWSPLIVIAVASVSFALVPLALIAGLRAPELSATSRHSSR